MYKDNKTPRGDPDSLQIAGKFSATNIFPIYTSNFINLFIVKMLYIWKNYYMTKIFEKTKTMPLNKRIFRNSQHCKQNTNTHTHKKNFKNTSNINQITDT